MNACSIPRRALRSAPDRSGDAGRPRAASRAPARRWARPRAPAGCEGKASCYMTPASNHAGAPVSSAISHSFDDWLCGRSGGAGSGGKPDKAGAVFFCSASVFSTFAFRKGYKSGVPAFVPFPSFRGLSDGFAVRQPGDGLLRFPPGRGRSHHPKPGASDRAVGPSVTALKGFDGVPSIMSFR